jgi:hypothetical protein
MRRIESTAAGSSSMAWAWLTAASAESNPPLSAASSIASLGVVLRIHSESLAASS